MTFTIKGSHIVAILITAFIGIYMYFGTLEIGGQSSASVETPAIAEREENKNSELFRVSYIALDAQARTETVTLRGRTQADALIPVKAETNGIMRQRLVDRGDVVKEGQLVCVIESGAREASLASAKASLEKAEAEYQANKTLMKKGFTTDTKMRELTANRNAAKARLQEAEIELARTEIRSTASGIVLDPIAEPGDMLAAGGTCITIVDKDPMFFIGQISESDISSVKTGMRAEVELTTGATAQGTLNYISPASDAQTRTFRVEIRLDEQASEIRDGITAIARIMVGETKAFRISPSWITLNDDGAVGLKIIDKDDKVQFQKIDLVAQGNDGFWIENLEPGSRVITLGQEYVISGEKVEPVLQQTKAQGNRT